ncbi:MAG: hypothetical protein OEZ34_08405 [Spirochaetia bacterium]|nr:hypothetical protein [Spirochaetia bacterium]
MKHKTIYFSAIFLILTTFIFPFKRKNKQKPVLKPKPCCVLGLATYLGESAVILEQICKSKSRMTIYFHTKNMSGTCAHPPSTILIDQKGRRYPLLNSIGIPDCSSGKLNQKPDSKFRWIFKAFTEDVKTFTLKEVEDDVTIGMQYWIWKDVDVSHCNFK